MSTYTIGIDYGTESGRALLVRTEDGAEVATAVHPYGDGVLDRTLPDGTRLGNDWALQNPDDYLAVLKNAVPAVLKESGVSPDEVVGVGIDFTACTMLPTLSDGTPLCRLPELRSEPHAWVKLWKHHAAQGQADRINDTARRMGEGWLARYGGKISSEWFFSKALQILEEAPEIYARAERLIEAADWTVWQLTGVETRNACTAGYKAIYQDGDFPGRDYFAARAKAASGTPLFEALDAFFAVQLAPEIGLLSRVSYVNDQLARLDRAAARAPPRCRAVRRRSRAGGRAPRCLT